MEFWTGVLKVSLIIGWMLFDCWLKSPPTRKKGGRKKKNFPRVSGGKEASAVLTVQSVPGARRKPNEAKWSLSRKEV